MNQNFGSNINLNRRKNSKIRTTMPPVVIPTAESRPLVGESMRVLPSNSKQSSVTDNVFDSESQLTDDESFSNNDKLKIQIATQHPRVGAIYASSARVLIVGQIGYTIVHTAIYAIGLRFWNVVTPYFLLMWFLEEIPNFYNLIVCIASLVDDYIPSNVSASTTQLQRILYYWKPPIHLLAFILLVLDIVPLCFGWYIWWFAEGTADQQIGQQTMVESTAVLLPYMFSLTLLYFSVEFLKVDLGLTFAGYRAKSHTPVVGSTRGHNSSLTYKNESQEITQTKSWLGSVIIGFEKRNNQTKSKDIESKGYETVVHNVKVTVL